MLKSTKKNRKTINAIVNPSSPLFVMWRCRYCCTVHIQSRYLCLWYLFLLLSRPMRHASSTPDFDCVVWLYSQFSDQNASARNHDAFNHDESDFDCANTTLMSTAPYDSNFSWRLCIWMVLQHYVIEKQVLTKD